MNGIHRMRLILVLSSSSPLLNGWNYHNAAALSSLQAAALALVKFTRGNKKSLIEVEGINKNLLQPKLVNQCRIGIGGGSSSSSAAAAITNNNRDRRRSCSIFNQFFQIPFARGIKMSTTSTSSNGSLARQNYHEETEGHVNRQINLQLHASYVYLSMAHYFDRDDVALHGLHEFFEKHSEEERELAEKLKTYQNKRGGRVVLQPIAKPSKDEWNTALEAMAAALILQKSLNENLLKIHAIASGHGDPHFTDFLEEEFLEHRVEAIKKMADYITQLNRVGSGLGEYIFDKELK